jgi:DNA-binding CsgD family transcriptional regulator
MCLDQLDQAPDSYTQALDALRAATIAVESARDRRGLTAGDTDGLEPSAAGTWSMVDGFESNGKRYAILRADEPKATPRPLSPRERQVVAFARLGRPSKLIAYDLGLADSTVRVLLRRARQKLGIRVRSDWSQVEIVPALLPGTYQSVDSAAPTVRSVSAG